MKVAMVATPPDEETLTLLAQLGIRHAVHYDMYDRGEPFEALDVIRRRDAANGLHWAVSKSGPALGRIILGLDGWEDETEAYKRSLQALGRDAMVVHTTYDRTTRGGARTSAFRLADLPAITRSSLGTAKARNACGRT